jgi:hypothetical protein
VVESNVIPPEEGVDHAKPVEVVEAAVNTCPSVPTATRAAAAEVRPSKSPLVVKVLVTSAPTATGSQADVLELYPLSIVI